jgi:hypothetical protein
MVKGVRMAGEEVRLAGEKAMVRMADKEGPGGCM